jgi:sulfate permease, SulP family
MKDFVSKFSLNNVFAGLIVAVVALPLCIAFAIASGAHPMAGVVSGVVGGFIAAAFGSSRFQVSGPAAAFIAILYAIATEHGYPVLLASTLVAGVVLIAISLLRLGRIVEIMPHSVIVGFTTGIGILIFLGQIPAAFGLHAQGATVLDKLVSAARHFNQANYYELIVLGTTLAVALAWGRSRLARWVPAPLVALAAGIVCAQGLTLAGTPVATVGALYDLSFNNLAPSAEFVRSVGGHLQTVLVSGSILGVLIAVESLLSSRALDSMTGSSHDPNRELRGLGLANLAVPFVGGIPVSGVIVRGSTNVMGGATEKTAAMMHAVFLALFVVALQGAIKLLPMAALAAVLLLTARRLIEVHELRRVLSMDRAEGVLTLVTAGLTVAVDLTVSVPVGVVLMLLLALRRIAEDLRIDVRERHGQPVLAVRSSITFLTAAAVKREMEDHLREGKVQALDLRGSHFIDATGAMMLAQVLDGHPELEVWVMRERGLRKLIHAGVPEHRVLLLGNHAVPLPEVFQAIQAKDA